MPGFSALVKTNDIEDQRKTKEQLWDVWDPDPYRARQLVRLASQATPFEAVDIVAPRSDPELRKLGLKSGEAKPRQA